MADTSPRGRSSSKSKKKDKDKKHSNDPSPSIKAKRSISTGAIQPASSGRSSMLDASSERYSSGSDHGNPFEDGDAKDSDELLVKTEPFPHNVFGNSPSLQSARTGMVRRVSIGSRGTMLPGDILTRPLAVSSESNPNNPLNVRGTFSTAIPSVSATSPRPNQQEVLAELRVGAPDLSTNSNEKLFTLSNVFINLKKEIIQQADMLREEMRQQEARSQVKLDAQLRQIRQNQVRNNYLVTDISRGAVYTIKNDTLTPLQEARSEESYKKSSTCGCFGFL